MSEKNSLPTRRTPASAPAGILSRDRTVTLRQKQVRRPPAVAGSNWRRPVILLGEDREPVRVALKKVLEACGYDVIVVERASEALSIATGHDGHIHFLITNVVFSGMNGGLLAHLFQCAHPETRTLFLSGSREEVLIYDGTSEPKTTVLKQPVRLDVFASKVSEMIETR